MPRRLPKRLRRESQLRDDRWLLGVLLNSALRRHRFGPLAAVLPSAVQLLRGSHAAPSSKRVAGVAEVVML